MSGKRSRFIRHAFHQIAVRADAVNKMVNNRKTLLIKFRRQMFLRHCHSHAVGKTLPKRSGRDFHAFGHKIFRMSGRLRMKLTEIFQFAHRQIIARQMQKRINQHRTVSGGKQKSIAVKPFRIFRIVTHKLRPQNISRRSHSQRQTGMPGIRLLHGIER